MLTSLPNPRFAAHHPLPPDTVVGIIGAGTMGAGIAEVAACGGHHAKRFDSIPEAVPRALEKVRLTLNESVSRGKLAPAAADDSERRMAPANSFNRFVT